MKTCEVCKFYQSREPQLHTKLGGTCRIRAPVKGGDHSWPHTAPQWWCGEWQGKPEPAKEGESWVIATSEGFLESGIKMSSMVWVKDIDRARVWTDRIEAATVAIKTPLLTVILPIS
tara:strand:+ start:1183 stop:1533 length:351 start_codon:yes stop_codon:yes gene_type:complete